MEVLDVFIDKLTILGTLKKSMEVDFQRVINHFSHVRVDSVRTSYARGQFFYEEEHSINFEYDGLFSEAMNKRNFRIEFNPSKISKEQKIFLRKEVLCMLLDVGFSRVDIAVDINDDLSGYYFEVFNKKKSEFYGRDGSAETFYFGSRFSDVYLRVYDKKKEMWEKRREVCDLDKLWRFELEVKGSSKVDELITNGFDSLIDFRIINYNYSTLSAMDKILLKSMYEFKNEFSELSKNTKTRIRKLARSCSGDDVSSVIKEAIKANNPLILRELESYARCSMKVF